MVDLDIIHAFFDPAAPCPGKINNCEELRKQYLDKFESLKVAGGCNTCRAKGLRNHYINVIRQNYKNE